MPSPLLRSLAVALASLAVGVPSAHAATAADLDAEIGAIVDTTATQWAGLVRPDDVFQNPYPWNIAAGHSSFSPPMLTYAVQRVGERTGNAALLAAAERAWPRSVDASRASSFEMIGAAYAARHLALSPERRAQLTSYLAAYNVPIIGRRCLLRPLCWSNLKLVDALAVLAITRLGVVAADPRQRLGNPAAARAAALAVVDVRLPQVSHRTLAARSRGKLLQGAIISDPPKDPLAYHALTAFMLHEAIELLGRQASKQAVRAERDAMEALSALMAPDGDVSYLGRGQGQVWVPALAAGALAGGAADAAAKRPVRAARYLAGAQRAVRRLAALHASPAGLQLVPGAAARTTHAGIDGYAHDVAYNGLALFGLLRAQDALAATPAVRVGTRIPADRRLELVDNNGGGGVGIVADGRTWLAVHRSSKDPGDLRQDIGALALKRRTPAGWVDLLAPRPLTAATTQSQGPALIRRGVAITADGFELRADGRTVDVRGGFRIRKRLLARLEMRWRLTRRGARLTVRGAKPGRTYRFLAFTQEGTGVAARRSLEAFGARWRFSRPIRVARIPGYHSGPVERLDALEARLTAPRSGRFSVTIGA